MNPSRNRISPLERSFGIRQDELLRLPHRDKDHTQREEYRDYCISRRSRHLRKPLNALGEYLIISLLAVTSGSIVGGLYWLKLQKDETSQRDKIIEFREGRGYSEGEFEFKNAYARRRDTD